MKSFGATSEIGEIEARIQARVGEFLSAKKKLMDLSLSPDFDIRTEAAGLLSVQKDLENQLPEALKTIDKIKTDVYSVSDLLTTGTFAFLMERHVRNVEDLVGKSKGFAPSFLSSLGDVSMDKILWGLAGVGFLFYFLKRRK